MQKVTLTASRKKSETAVANIFLDRYMCNANGEFVKVYLYLLRCMNLDDPAVTVSEIADRLNLTEKDVLRALKYWAKEQVLDVVFDKDAAQPAAITFLPLDAVSEEAAAQTPDAPRAASGGHAMSPAKVRRFKEREDIKQLLYIVERYIGKPLTSTEVGTVLYFYEDLHFETELIEYLVEYCVAGGHTSLRYMEKVALAWSDNGIRNVAEAKEAAAVRSSRFNIVMKTFGISDRSITPVESEFINRWYDEYGFDKEMITEACRRTIMSMNKPNFSYADGILKKWRQAHVHTPDDLKALDASFHARVSVSATGKAAGASASSGRFNGFSQRTYNFDEMERALISNNK